MDYNWEEIFIDKSNKDLYDIYIGNSTLPKSTIPLAKRELENRNFDFDNMEGNKTAWKLSKLLQEEEFELLAGKRKTFLIPFKFYLLAVSLIILVFFFITPRTNDSIYIGFPMLLTLASLFYFSNNYSFKKEQAKKIKRNNEKLELIKKLEKEELLQKESPVVKDIEREWKKDSKKSNIMIYVTIGIVLIIIILKIIKNYP